MKNNTSNIIAGYAWDCTVGAGDDRELRAQDIARLAKVLGRELSDLTSEEVKLFRAKWNECLQCMAQP